MAAAPSGRRRLGTPFDLDVTLAFCGGFTVCDRTEACGAFQCYGRMIFGITLKATVSFTGAETTVALRRNFF